MYRKILVPLDGTPLSEAALEHLPHVAGAETEVLLLRVLEAGAAPAPAASPAESTPVPPLTPSPGAVAAADTAAAKAFADAEEHLEAKAAAVHGHVLATRTMVLGGADPGAVIAGVARDEQVDLIVMASHGRSGVARWVLGSVAERVLHSTHVPILLIRAGRPAE
jgi:nucleotide-binding universal stress UspA family protein